MSRKEKQEIEKYLRQTDKPIVANSVENINDLLELSNEELDRSCKIISEVCYIYVAF
jgi:hypothetical protein